LSGGGREEMRGMFWALLVGTVVLLGSVLSYGMATALIVRVVVRLIQAGYTGLEFWKSVVVMAVVTVITAGAHLTQIALWAVVFLSVGEIATVQKAFYYSAENYTALGYGDIVLSERWQLLGPLEAINGLLLFGLSTSVMFAVMSRLIANRLGVQLGHVGEAGGNSAGTGMTDERGHVT
jgi:ion channel